MAPISPPEPPLTDGTIALRPIDERDVDAIWVSCQDPVLQRFIPVPRPYRRADAEGYVRRTQRDWLAGTKAAFAIVDTSNHDTLFGAINVAISGRTGNSGYWIEPAARGEGIATRALRLLTHWALDVVGLGVVILEIRPENAASIRVATAAGYHEAGSMDINDVTGETGGLIFSRLASDSG